MVSVQIYGTDIFLETTDSNITYIKTAGDLGEITTVNSSYSWSMKFPKSPNNTQVLDSLGLVGSTSRKPYEKVYVNLLDNGYPIVIKGLLNIKETNDNYNIYIQEGFIDFLKDINVDTIGEDLDVSPLNHTRNLATIVNSLSLSLPYAYLISDVNGAYLPNENDTTNLDPRYMSPYANVGFIWDLIFSTYGWTYTMNDQVNQSINDYWMSYPSEIVFDDSAGVEIADLGLTNGLAIRDSGPALIWSVPLPNRIIDANYILPSNLSSINYIIQETGNYEITFGSRGNVILEDYNSNVRQVIYLNRFYINGVKVQNGADSGGDLTTFQAQLFQGDVLTLKVYTPQTAPYTTVNIHQAVVKVSYLNQGQVDFTKALIKYKISDFLKEIMIREALTPFVDAENKHIEFLTLTERVGADSVNWTDKYSKRISETYLYKDYAQNNYLVHKYENDVDDYNNGNLFISNLNLEEEKDIFVSKSFSPSNELRPFEYNNVEYQVPRLPMFEVEVSEDKDTGNLIGTYKFLKDRFFFVKSVQSTRDIYIDTSLVSTPPLVSLSGVTFSDIVADEYENFNRISDDAKVHTIELALSLMDILTLDLRKIYYFEQEGSFYILNSLSYKTGQKCKGVFLKVQPLERNRAFSNAFSGAFSI